jgi:hypothetical protein
MPLTFLRSIVMIRVNDFEISVKFKVFDNPIQYLMVIQKKRFLLTFNAHAQNKNFQTSCKS